MSPEMGAVLSFRKVLAITVAFALVMWSLGLPGWLHQAYAAPLTNVSDTLSDSGLSDPSNHTIQFTTPNGAVGSGATTTVITLPAGFDMSSITEDDVDIADDGTDLTTEPTTCAAAQAAVNIYDQQIDIHYCSGTTIASSSVVTIEVGNHASASGSGLNQISNPGTSNSYLVSISAVSGTPDSGETRVFIIEDVTVTASVDTTMSFSIQGTATSTSINDDADTTTGSTTATAIPFGSLTPDTNYLMGQLLTISTNAPNGYTVTVSADSTLTSSGLHTIDPFIDGNQVGSSTVWTNPAGTFGSPDTYGHWGITSDDDDVGSTTLTFGGGSPLYVGNFINNPVPVMYHASSTNGSGQGIGTTTVGYKLRVTSLQEAGSDYTSTLTYVATPVF